MTEQETEQETEQGQVDRAVLASEAEQMRQGAEERRLDAEGAWERAEKKAESSQRLAAAREEAGPDA